MKRDTFWLKRYRIIPGEPIPRRKVYIFMICLFSSAIFWLTIKLSQEGQGFFSQPIAIVDIPAGMFLSSQSHSIIRYSVRTTGARMLTSQYFLPTDTFRVNASGLPSMVRDDQTLHYLTYSSIAFRVANRLRADVELVNVWPDTLFLELVPAMEKKVPVQIVADISFARRFNQYGPVTVVPDSITITGPEALVDTLSFIETRYFVAENISSRRIIDVPLRRPAGLHRAGLSHDFVEVEIPAEEFTESSVEIPLQIRCPEEVESPAGSDLVLFPPGVTLTYLVALRDYGRTDTTAFSAHVVCPPEEKLPDRLEVVVDRIPPNLIFQYVRPRSVEYLIVK